MPPLLKDLVEKLIEARVAENGFFLLLSISRRKSLNKAILDDLCAIYSRHYGRCSAPFYSEKIVRILKIFAAKMAHSPE